MTEYERAEWKALRIKYVTGNMTLASLASKAGVSLSLFSHRAVVESWELKRNCFRRGQECVRKVDRGMDLRG